MNINEQTVSRNLVLSFMFKSRSISEKVRMWCHNCCSNIVNAIGLLGIEHNPCVAHMQFSNQNGLKVMTVQQVLGRCRRLVKLVQKLHAAWRNNFGLASKLIIDFSATKLYKLQQKQETLKLNCTRNVKKCLKHVIGFVIIHNHY